MAIGFGKSEGMQRMHGGGKVNSIRLDEICPRYSNKFINDKEEFEGLKQSIRESGLIQPIIVENIETFLNSESGEKLNEKANNYYKGQLAAGRKYFITVGHRRYYAFCSLCVGEDFTKKEMLDDFYTKFSELYELNELAIEGEEGGKRNKYLSIKAEVGNDNYDQEKEKYVASNLNQRSKKDFEIIINILDDLEETGALEKKIEEIKKNKIEPMSERAVEEALKKLKNTEKYKTIEEAKALLMKYDYRQLNGCANELNLFVQDYIMKRRRKEVTIASISYAFAMLNIYDEEIIQKIYDGDLKYAHAREMYPIYRDADDKEKEQIRSELLDGSINTRKWKLKKEKAKVKVEVSNKQLLKMIKQIYDGKRTIEDVYEELKLKNML